MCYDASLTAHALAQAMGGNNTVADVLIRGAVPLLHAGPSAMQQPAPPPCFHALCRCSCFCCFPPFSCQIRPRRGKTLLRHCFPNDEKYSRPQELSTTTYQVHKLTHLFHQFRAARPPIGTRPYGGKQEVTAFRLIMNYAILRDDSRPSLCCGAARCNLLDSHLYIASAPAHAPAPAFVVASAFSASHPNSSLLLKAKRSHSVLD